ncbi:MAG: hypothetical protein C9356_08760 [Oleiphilus sp.]|nr:MAG: hypothetical protein C9356_08760 [Oleiphilus sp.]
MNLLEAHKHRLEQEIVSAKEKIWTLKNSDFPDLIALNQLNESVARNWQLIEMIDQHLHGGENREMEG